MLRHIHGFDQTESLQLTLEGLSLTSQESQPSPHLINKSVQCEAAAPFCPTCNLQQFLRHWNAGQAPGNGGGQGTLLPSCPVEDRCGCRHTFQKQMSNLYFSVWSRGREHAAASSEEGRADPGCRSQDTLSLQKCYHWSQNRLVWSAFDSLWS